MKKVSLNNMDDGLRPEYDLRGLSKGGVRGKYAERFRSEKDRGPIQRR